MKIRTPSPALVLSLIALVVACAGTAYAATRITSSSQIRNGVITGADIRRNTITSSKLSAGTRRLINRRSGVGGSGIEASGGAGALEAIRKAGPQNQPANVVVKVASLSIPAGAYLITAKTVMTPFTGTTNIIEALASAPGSLGGHCRLDAAGDVDDSTVNIVVQNRPTPATLYMQLTRTVAGTTNVDLLCDAAAPWTTSDTTIVATRVASASRTDATATGA